MRGAVSAGRGGEILMEGVAGGRVKNRQGKIFRKKGKTFFSF